MFKKGLKKVLAMTIALACVFTGCASGTAAPTPVEENGATSEVTNQDVKAGFIFMGPVADGGWSQSHNEGRLQVEEELGIETLYKESVPETQEVEKVARDMIDQGCNVIFAASFGYMDYIEKLAKEFPEVKFFHCSGYKTAENMSNYFGKIEDARYLSGMVAGLKTESNQIGYVAAMPIPEVIRGINAFALGVKAVNPEAQVKVSWTNAWYDPAKEKEAGTALIDQGCDVLGQHQNAAGAQQAAEEKGVWSIGYHADMSAVAPNANLTSVVWNWGPYYVNAVKSVMDGTFKSESYWEGINAGIVDISPLTKNAPAEAAAVVDAAKQQMLDGALHAFQGPIVDQTGTERVPAGSELSNEDQLACDWFVDNVVGEIN
ncbi:MAG: BMP family ABC transporter substrate-binding protein [Niameybacter sp.]|uniref:BMP family ABC transporter substrate-binding protein n=1 Tax=Niameybacter sp. TaxID=2033640 RepID=UPI002FCC661D